MCAWSLRQKSLCALIHPTSVFFQICQWNVEEVCQLFTKVSVWSTQIDSRLIPKHSDTLRLLQTSNEQGWTVKSRRALKLCDSWILLDWSFDGCSDLLLSGYTKFIRLSCYGRLGYVWFSVNSSTLVNWSSFLICCGSCESCSVLWEIESCFYLLFWSWKPCEGIVLVNLFVILCKQHRNFYFKDSLYWNAMKVIHQNAVKFGGKIWLKIWIFASM